MRHRGPFVQMMLVVLLCGSIASTAPGPWFAPDRIKHFFLSFFVQSATYSIARVANVEHNTALIGASGVTAAAAVSKEVWDRRRGSGFDAVDLVWDGLGAGLATVLLVRTAGR